MGVLSDLVAAPPTAGQAIARSRAPAQQFGGIDVKGIDIVKFATLEALLTDAAVADVLREYEPVASGSDDGPWVFQLPTALVERLPALTEPQLSNIAVAWASTDEFVLDRWDPRDVRAVLRDISTLARSARAQGHVLFLWMSM